MFFIKRILSERAARKREEERRRKEEELRKKRKEILILSAFSLLCIVGLIFVGLAEKNAVPTLQSSLPSDFSSESSEIDHSLAFALQESSDDGFSEENSLDYAEAEVSSSVSQNEDSVSEAESKESSEESVVSAEPIANSSKETASSQTENSSEYSSAAEEESTDRTERTTYILSLQTKKFHTPNCIFIDRISNENRAESSASRETLLANGYSPCKKCRP
ncbi:MAG TPA: hypothetical protein DCE08_07615 [Ruminococcaceae bacterium]|nr:hypothetical protein [Oscillospiraceae bacterium]